MNRLQTLQEWFKYFRNGLIFAAIAVAVLFWDSPRPADEIAVSIAVPLLIFNCIPILITGLNSFVRSVFKSPQKELPLPPNVPPPFSELPLKTRFKALAILFTVIAMMVAFFASIAIFAGSFLYSYFGIAWAVAPARELALCTFGVTVLPIVAIFSFVAGMYYTGRIWSSIVGLNIYLRTIRPLSYWPTSPA